MSPADPEMVPVTGMLDTLAAVSRNRSSIVAAAAAEERPIHSLPSCETITCVATAVPLRGRPNGVHAGSDGSFEKFSPVLKARNPNSRVLF